MKGVVCKVRKDSDMPVDDFGNRADILVYEKGAIARLNPGQFYEQFINMCSRDITLDVREMMSKGKVEEAWQHLLTYYKIAAPKMVELIDHDDLNERDAILQSVVNNGIYLYIPANDPNLGINIYEEMMAFRPPNVSCLTYTTVNGDKIRTASPIMIGEMDIIVLDKADHKPMSVSGILRQHHGLAAVENKGTKHSTPSKEQPAKVIGETEARTAAAVMGGEAVAELMDYVNNPESHREIVRKIFTAENPSSIDNIIDRDKIPRGTRALAFVKHVAECAGWDIVDQK